MSPTIATIAYGIGILGLLALDHDGTLRTSRALWIPVVWLFIEASRPVSLWLQTSPPGSADTYLEGSPLDRGVFLLLSIAAFVVLLWRRRRVAGFLHDNRALLLFFLYCGISVFWSDYGDVAFRRWVKAVGELAVVLVVLTDAHPSAALKRLLSRVGFVVIPLSVLFIKYYGDLGRDYRPGGFGGVWNTIYTGVTTDKNALGMITMIFGLAALWQSLELWKTKDAPHRGRRAIAQAVLLGTACWLFWITNSMTSLSCALVAGVLLVGTNSWAFFRKRAVINTLVIAFLCITLCAIFVAPDLLSLVERDPTLTGRTAIWNLVLEMTGNRVFGTGFESFWLGPRLQRMWSIYWWHPNEAHNGYLEVFLDLGWVGVALFAGVLVAGYRKVLISIRQREVAGSLMLAFFVAALIYNITESGIRELNPIWFVFLLAIISVPAPSVSEEELRAGTDELEDRVESEPELQAFAASELH
jgi:exopolysaccharide production protein ExoQ